MIVKAISHKSAKKKSIAKLIAYCFNEKKTVDINMNRESVIVKRFIRSFDQEKWIESFQKNDMQRNFNHKNRTVLRHEIVSFSKADNEKINSEMLYEFGKWYLNNRSNAIGIGTVHWEESIHFHFIIAGVGNDGNSTRVSREDFKKFKIRLQDYQMEYFPELTNSIVNHSKKNL